jgi:NADH-quinone oxidoreductase subunit H
LLQATDIDVAVLYFIGVVSVGVYGIMIGGWASNNKFSLIGAIRAASQMVSYEVAMGLSIIALLMMTGTLSLKEISMQQSGMNWNVFYQPFDLPECETELIGGYHTEYSSMKMGFYLFAEYANMFISSTLLSVLFFGGYNYPGMSWAVENWGVNIANMLGMLALFIKLCGFIFFYMWVRWTIPRFRYDQLMHLGWRILIPLSIINIMITGIVLLRVEIMAYLGL